MVIRAFVSMFHPKHPRLVPSRRSFERIIKRFPSTANCQPRHPRVEKLDENVAIVRNYFDQNKETSIRMASKDLQQSYGTVLRILKSKLGWSPIFSGSCTNPCSYCSTTIGLHFWINFSDEWFDRVIWTDEKMFVLTQAPHRQNDRVWSSPNKMFGET